MLNVNLSVTLWPSFPHFPKFVKDDRISSIRLNSAMMNNTELEEELLKIHNMDITTPLFFDVKGRQLRITEVIPNDNFLDIRINHPVTVDTPVVVLFKAGADYARLLHVIEDGFRLQFLGGPTYMVKAGESLHIRDETLVVGGNQFTDLELDKIERVKKAGFKHYFLSYVECQRDVDEFIELVGKDSVVNLKIENKAGLSYVEREFKKTPGVNLVAARGDLYVEVDKPHEILEAVKLIIDKDPEAIVGSRILLSVIADKIPSCADFHELAWLYDIGYRNMMLCDELCLKNELLSRAVNVFQSWKETYRIKELTPPVVSGSLFGRLSKRLRSHVISLGDSKK